MGKGKVDQLFSGESPKLLPLLENAPLSFVCKSCYTVALGSGLFPFAISFDAPDSIANIADRLDAPAGKHGVVTFP